MKVEPVIQAEILSEIATGLANSDPKLLLFTGGFLLVGSLFGYAAKKYFYPAPKPAVDVIPPGKREKTFILVDEDEFKAHRKSVNTDLMLHHQMASAMQEEQKEVLKETWGIRNHVEAAYKKIEALLLDLNKSLQKVVSGPAKAETLQESILEENAKLLRKVDAQLEENKQLLVGTQQALNYTAIRVETAANKVISEVKKASEEVGKAAENITTSTQAIELLVTENITRYEEFEDGVREKVDGLSKQLRIITKALRISKKAMEEATKAVEETAKEASKEEKMALPGALSLLFLLKLLYSNFNGWATFARDLLRNAAVIGAIVALTLRVIFYYLGVLPVIGYLTIPALSVTLAYLFMRYYIKG